MNREEIIARTAEILQESFELTPEQLKPEANLFMDLGLDSLDMVDLMIGVSKACGVQIQDGDEVRAIRTVQELHEFLFRAVENSQAPCARE